MVRLSVASICLARGRHGRIEAHGQVGAQLRRTEPVLLLARLGGGARVRQVGARAAGDAARARDEVDARAGKEPGGAEERISGERL